MNRSEVDAFFGSNFLSEWRGFNAAACCRGGNDRCRDDFRRRLWSCRCRRGRFGTGVASGSGVTTAGVLFSAAGASSPASPTAAMAPPTATSSPTPQYCLIKTPSSKHSTSIVALSVSTSAIMSPLATGSPSFFNHLTSVPTVMVSLSLGMSMSVAIF